MERPDIKINKKYGNYVKHPNVKVERREREAWSGEEAKLEIRNKVAELLNKTGRAVVCMDIYPGTRNEEVVSFANFLSADFFYETENYLRERQELMQSFERYITDDRVFGYMCREDLEEVFDCEQIFRVRNEIRKIKNGVVVVSGVGAGLFCENDIWIYFNMTRWEIQLRYRDGMGNWLWGNGEAPLLEKYKRGFFIEWRMADRYKSRHMDRFDYFAETEKRDGLHMVTGGAYRDALCQTVAKPFRLEPYFDPGVWGGKWMQIQFDLDKEQNNYAWSFDGVPEENAINYDFGNVICKFPAMDIVLYRPKELLGNRVYCRFGAEFPIRFDMLDTMGGGNLSLQVHPMSRYIRDKFGMDYTQDESYYLLDVGEPESAYVYLGLRQGVDKEEMKKDLYEAGAGLVKFPVEKYINKISVKQDDHVLIPAGTVHCSGENTMVLEISATPYIFTFKMWDWGRVGLDGLPRPLHLEHGIENIQWDRDTEWVRANLVGQTKVVDEGDGWRAEKTGLHELEFIDTHRYTLTKRCTVEMDDTVHVLNLVGGKSAYIIGKGNRCAPFEIHYAETVIIPAAVGTYEVVSSGEEIKVLVASIRR